MDAKNNRGFAGLSNLVSEVDDLDEPIDLVDLVEENMSPSQNQMSQCTNHTQVEHTHSHQKQQKELSNNRKDYNSCMAWCVLIVIFLSLWGVTASISDEERIPSAQREDTTRSKQAPVEAYYQKPQIGTGELLSIPQIRWCLREEIRLEVMRDIFASDSGIAKFNNRVDTYNYRCGSYRYKSGELAQAESDVKPYRALIQEEAIHEARRLENNQ